MVEWEKEINDLDFDSSELEYLFFLSGKASTWNTCLFGDKCDDLPKDKDGAPIDGELKSLGELFGAHFHSLTDSVEAKCRDSFNLAKISLKDVYTRMMNRMNNINTPVVKEEGWVIMVSDMILGWTFKRLRADAIKEITSNTNLNWNQWKRKGYKCVKSTISISTK